jgi:hypothetical protein
MDKSDQRYRRLTAYGQESYRESSITNSLSMNSTFTTSRVININKLEREHDHTSNPRIAPYIVLAYKDRKI